jgi:hypothetical protein
MRLAVGADHLGYLIRGKVIQWLRDLGHEVVDVGGCHGNPSGKVVWYGGIVPKNDDSWGGGRATSLAGDGRIAPENSSCFDMGILISSAHFPQITKELGT